MHTAPDLSRTSAAVSAETEATSWLGIARNWAPTDHGLLWSDVPGAEKAVIGLYDPVSDLDRRMNEWGYPPGSHDLADVARFAAGLAQAEAEAWRADRAHVATKAYSDRRFLLGDRILHWAVPWLDMVSRWYPNSADLAHETRRTLLDLGDRHRPAPALAGTEGLVVPGFDAFGPIDPGVSLATLTQSVWSGAVLCTPQLTQIRHAQLASRNVSRKWLHDTDTRHHLFGAYRDAAERWDRLAADHPGSAQLWRDLSRRAARTSTMLRA